MIQETDQQQAYQVSVDTFLQFCSQCTIIKSDKYKTYVKKILGKQNNISKLYRDKPKKLYVQNEQTNKNKKRNYY